jgi:hypothetical protein
MATYFFGINNGDNEYAVTSAATSTGKDVEVAINTTANVPSQEELQLSIEKLVNAILRAGKSW